MRLKAYVIHFRLKIRLKVFTGPYYPLKLRDVTPLNLLDVTLEDVLASLRHKFPIANPFESLRPNFLNGMFP